MRLIGGLGRIYEAQIKLVFSLATLSLALSALPSLESWVAGNTPLCSFISVMFKPSREALLQLIQFAEGGVGATGVRFIESRFQETVSAANHRTRSLTGLRCGE